MNRKTRCFKGVFVVYVTHKFCLQIRWYLWLRTHASIAIKRYSDHIWVTLVLEGGNGARYVKSKRNVLSVNNWIMFSPTLLRFEPRKSDIQPGEWSNMSRAKAMNHYHSAVHYQIWNLVRPWVHYDYESAKSASCLKPGTIGGTGCLKWQCSAKSTFL